jgi:hypothetical protein
MSSALERYIDSLRGSGRHHAVHLRPLQFPTIMIDIGDADQDRLAYEFGRLLIREAQRFQ